MAQGGVRKVGLLRRRWLQMLLSALVLLFLVERTQTYKTFEEADEKGMPSDILAMAASEISDGYVQKLDI
jgi:hypothetical protein